MWLEPLPLRLVPLGLGLGEASTRVVAMVGLAGRVVPPPLSPLGLGNGRLAHAGGEMLRFESRPPRQDESMLHRIGQFADIAGPGVVHQHIHGGRGDFLGDLGQGTTGGAGKQMASEGNDILPALP